MEVKLQNGEDCKEQAPHTVEVHGKERKIAMIMGLTTKITDQWPAS